MSAVRVRLSAVLFAALGGLVLLTVGASSADASPDPGEGGSGETLQAYEVQGTAAAASGLRAAGYDISATTLGEGGQVSLEVIMTPDDAAEVRELGLTAQARQTQGSSFQQTGVFRPWSGPGNLEEEVRQLAADHPDITDLQVVGQSVNGQDILAVRVTADADSTPLGARPAVLYTSTAHAREWIVPEVNRRLLRLFLENYDSGTDTELTELVDTTDLYFVIVSNPDGYDYTFTAGNRLWRKNLQDNNDDGIIAADADGVDLNRNWPYQWGYDNEGSSPDPANATYRGPGPASEPETQAMDAFIGRIDPVFMVDYHSAANLILYGAGSQVATPTPDDVILEALAGDDANPAVEGYDPDLSAELYITNGASTEHAANVHGVLAYTPELSTCQSVALPGDPPCQSVFNFPDDEARIEEEFQKNIPFALDMARSADDPFEPDSHIGNTAADFVIDPFDEAHSGTTEVAATISRQVGSPELNWSINGGPTQTAATAEWAGGERYGDGFSIYYREVRGAVTGAELGDSVEVWFSGNGDASDRFTYDVVSDPANVLVIANEDYDGFNPEQPDVDEPQFAQIYVDALEAASYNANVWDLDARGVPHHLGVLAHYDAVIWYSGQNRLTQGPDDTGFGGDALVDESMNFLSVSLRDYLNEGGKVLHTGESAAYFGIAADAGFGGALVADNGDITSTCTNPGACLLWSDDFHQYWMGAWTRSGEREATQVVGTRDPLSELVIELSDEVSPQDLAGEFLVTSEILPPGDFPQFESQAVATYSADDAQAPFAPRDSQFYVGVPATNLAYNRLTRTIDLTGASPGDAAALSFATSFDVEGAYDFFAVEARTEGLEDWTTLPDENGNTVQGPLFACDEGLWEPHPFLFDHYVDGNCNPTGPTGEFHAFNGTSGGYTDVVFDLTPYVGSVVEISLAYISDEGVTNTGVVVDDVMVAVAGAVETQDFENDAGAWAATSPPAGSPAATVDWERTDAILPELTEAAAITTEDTVFLPWGLEAIKSSQQRTQVFLALMDGLTGLDRPDPVESVTITIQGDAVVAEFELAAGFDQSAQYVATAYVDGEPVAQAETDSSPATLQGIEPGVVVEVGVASVVNNINGPEVLSDELFFSPEQPDGITRISSGNRIQNAIEMCQYLVPDYTQARRVVLARDDAFADALAGSPLAGPDACILFTEGGPDAELNAEVAAEIDRVLDDGDDVFVLGGVNAVSDTVEAALTDAYDVTRFAGTTRFETAAQIAQYVHALDPGAEALVAYGLNWPDALVGGAYAARTGVPIVLSDTASLHPAAAGFMGNAEIESATLLGGTAVLSDEVLAAVPGGERVAGPNRMGTAAAIAQELWPGWTNGEGAVFINADADDAWLFALAAAPLSAASGEPQLGVRAEEIPTETQPLLAELVRGQVIGDASHISEAVEAALRSALGG